MIGKLAKTLYRPIMNRFNSGLMFWNQHEVRNRFILLLRSGHVTKFEFQLWRLGEVRLDFAQNGEMDP